MKLATHRDRRRDGTLLVVSRDLKLAASAEMIAPNLMTALEQWDNVVDELAELYNQLNAGQVDGAIEFNPRQCAAPLPRANQWLDASTFSAHGRLMQRSLKIEKSPSAPFPLMLQGWAADLRGPYDDEPVPSEDVEIDFEAEIGCVTGTVPPRATVEQAAAAIKLLVLVNDWSLRSLVPAEIASGFGFLRSKAPTAFGPVALTPDELGASWKDGRVHLPVQVHYNGRHWGHPSAAGMDYGFPELVAHAATNRRLLHATIIGSGTISEGDPPSVGSSCIAEMRGYEIIHDGAPKSPYMRFGDRVHIEMFGSNGKSLFGAIDQQVVPAT